MNRSRRSNRFGLGRGLRSLLGKRKKPLDLARAAGAVESFEALEQRQLLFTLTVGPENINPLTGLGTVSGTFSYFVPQLIRTAATQNNPPQGTTENFDQEFPAPPPANILGGTTWQTGIRLEYTANSVQLVQVAQGDNEIRVQMGPSQMVKFSLWEPPQPNQAAAPSSTQTISFDINGGLNTDDVTITLFGTFDEIIATYTGQAIIDHGQANGAGSVRYTFQGAASRHIHPRRDDLLVSRAPSDSFNIDNISFAVASGPENPTNNNRLFGATLRFAAPLGATITFLDLQGRDMIASQFLGIIGNNHLIGDPDGNGIINYNDGIGRVIITGTNEFSTFTLFGGTYTLTQGFQLVANPAGQYGEIEQTGGFGFDLTTDVPPRVTGMPAGSGSVILGSPWIPSNNPAGGLATPVPVRGNFVRSNQGIFVQGGASIGSVYVHGMVFGSSQFSGAVGRMVIGNPMGSFSVTGDLGSFVASADAGVWVRDDGNVSVATGGQLIVGRTIGEIDVGGRMMLNTTVLGDMSRPTVHQPGEIFRYLEKEWSPNIGTTPQVVATIAGVLNASQFLATANILGGIGLFFGRQSQQIVFADTYMRNDTLMGAEWIGSAATAVQINGDLGANDPVMTRQDPSDAFGFAADGSQEIVVELAGTLRAQLLGLTARLVDKDGRTVAAPQIVASDPRRTVSFRYRPNAPGVYYLVVSSRDDGAGAVLDGNYVLTVSGMAANTLGAFHTAGGFGLLAAGAPPSLNVLAGSVGSLRIGTGYLAGGGGDANPGVIYNIAGGDTADSSLAYRNSTVSIPGNLYGIVTGSDVEGAPGGTVGGSVRLTVGGNLGIFQTGQSPLFGLNANNGDFRSVFLSVGGAIGMMDIRGAMGIDQDPPGLPKPPDAPGSIVIRTGTDPQRRGDIGMIRVGWHAGAGSLTLRTPNGSVVGGLLISQDVGDDGSIYNGIYGPGGNTGLDVGLGFNSDLRFFDTSRIWLQNVPGVLTPMISGQVVTFNEDSGASVQLVLEGGDGTATGTVKVMPVGGSLGVAVGRIEVNLTGGATLHITSTGTNTANHVVSLGRIILTGADAASNVIIDGTVQVDVFSIIQTGGDAIASIQNTTPNGDLVAVDVVGLTSLIVGTGDLGRTQVPAWGPQLIGPFLGIAEGTAGGANGPIGVPGGIMTAHWNGNLYREVNNAVANAGTSQMDDVGSPVSPYLNGLIVRTGNITQVEAGGAIGDVVAADGNIISVRANADTNTPTGKFDGIIGTIYANRIQNVDIGDGLAQRDESPISTTGIFANDDIATITSTRPNAVIKSVINAANINLANADNDFPIDGIASVNLSQGGNIVDAWISSMTLDQFWSGFYPDDSQYRGIIGEIRTLANTPGATGGNLLRSDVVAAGIATISLSGFYDASRVEAAGDLQRLEARGFRNSTVNGGDLEFQINQVLVAGNLGILTTGTAGAGTTTGDISDLIVDVLGRTTEISANNISRSSFDSDLAIDQFKVEGSLRGSSLTTGLLNNADIKHNLANSRVSVAGPLLTLKVGDAVINGSINVTGPDGRLEKLTARTGFTGSITSAGPIDTVEVTEGDLIAVITTTQNQHGTPGNIKTLKAARDLDLRTDISGTVEEFIAGRHFGKKSDPSVVLVHGDVKKLDVSHGAVYSDLRVGQKIDEVLIGAVVGFPGNNLVGRGSIIAFSTIGTVTIEGDFGGTIQSASGGIDVITINNGSLLPSASITVLDGTLNNIVINNGNLYGNVHADWNILSIRLNGGEDGVFGDIGVNPAFSAGVAYDSHRNQLPPNVAANGTAQGPTITAGFNLGRIILTNGSIFEAFIWAGRAIGTIDVVGDITRDSLTFGQATVIAAGSSIFTVHTTGDMVGVDILVGVKSFGDDNLAGGIGGDADTVRSGRITTVQVDGSANGLHVSAGMDPGADGLYNTFDELVVPGISYVRTVTVGGLVSDTSVFADSATLTASPGIVKAGTSFANLDPDLSSGAAVPGGAITPNVLFNFTWAGVSGTILFTGPGTAYWDAVAGRVSLVNSKLTTDITISANGTLTNFKVVTNDDASMGHIAINAPLAGNSIVDVDAYCLGIAVSDVADNTSIRAGMNLRSFTAAVMSGGFVRGHYWVRDIVVGSFGIAGTFDEARIDLLAGQTVTVNGTDSGLVNVERDLASFEVNGAMNRGQLRTGASLGSFKAGSINQSRISVADSLGSVDVDGDVTETAIMAGGDLGEDAAPGGTGFDADRATTGFVGDLDIAGNFAKSSVVAGMLRGPDGFFGTTDDVVAPGRSTVGDVTIAGSQVGSNLFTEQYRVSATGGIGDVEIGGNVPPTGGNFRVESLATMPTPIRVVDLQVTQDSDVWTATFFFNQALDASTLGPALTISEVRNSGLDLIPLIQGTDYTIGEFNLNNNSIVVTFSRIITDRNLIPQGGPPAPGGTTPGTQDPALAGPGVFRFELDADTLRARVANARLDGDSNGFAATSEDYSQDTVVGDAGDKFEAEVDNIGDLTADQFVDMYAPADLDVVLDNNLTPDGLPDPNQVYTLRGTIGDHPDNDVNNFRFAGDTDIYKITLQAGQILRLGAMSGPALFATRDLYNSSFELQGFPGSEATSLPVDPLSILELTQPSHFLILTTGTYYIVVTNADNFANPGEVPNITPGSGNTGKYTFGIEIFDDGDSGFAAGNNSGNGTSVVNAPAAIVFAGPNGVFQTPGDPGYDDLSAVTIGDYRFFLDAGPDGQRGTNDDVVSGNNSAGISSVRAGGTMTSTINSAIGPAGHTGVPGDVAADVDIFHLNNGQTVVPGTLITITVKFADLGADLGGFSQLTLADFRGDVQFAVFDTTDATGIDDALLIFSPTDFAPRSGEPGELARQGPSVYGYDANGDFFISFVVPPHLGGTVNQPTKLAVYLQGAFNTDYSIQVAQGVSAPALAVPQFRQNVFIETRGGTIDWLEAGDLSTKIAAYTTSVLGLTGSVAGMPVDQYVLTQAVARVQSVFAATGLNVTLSTDPSAFEFQDFSRVFLTSTNDPITIFNRTNFGYAEHSDPYNLDRNDEAVVFLPSLASLGYTPSQADIDALVLSLSAAMGRRIGELMGLRLTVDSDFFDDPVDIMSANSVFNTPIGGGTYAIDTSDRSLSSVGDTDGETDFFLGRQNAFQLLDKFITP